MRASHIALIAAAAAAVLPAAASAQDAVARRNLENQIRAAQAQEQLRQYQQEAPAAQQAEQRLNDLDSARNAVNDATAVQSSSLATLQSLQNLTGDLKLTADGRIGDLSGTDYAQAVVKMQEQATALQAIYATTVQILQPGLLDFIK